MNAESIKVQEIITNLLMIMFVDVKCRRTEDSMDLFVIAHPY
jgi:hypothetical protein